jgi:hypothetical protein
MTDRRDETAGFDLFATNALPTTLRLRESGYGERLGRLFTPRHFSSMVETIEAGVKIAVDNDCFQGLDLAAFSKMLAALEPYADRVEWVTAPDVVGEAAATLESFAWWGPVIRSKGFRVALVLQDGMTVETVPWGEFDAVFVGGSTDWKLGAEARAIVEEARRRDLPAHMGRVNSYKRAVYAHAIGCTSIDGSGWARFKTAMLPRWQLVLAAIG